jgi:hypothetical protein
MMHRIFAGIGAALLVVGHNVPGPIGWVSLAVGGGILAAVDGPALLPKQKGTTP